MAYFLGFLYLAAYIVIYLSLLLLPYYVAYSIIEPHSFLGVVGVFILGSVIVPLTLGLAFLVFGSFFVAFDKFKEKIAQKPQSQPLSPYRNESLSSNDSSPLDETINPKKENSKNVFLFSMLGLGALGVILIFVLNEAKNTEGTPYYETMPADESTENSSTSYHYSDTTDGKIEETYLPDSNIQDNYNYMIYAVDEFLKIMSESGISGVARGVRDCYVNTEIDNLYCVYLDNTARLVDSTVSKDMGFIRNEYLSDDRVLSRNYKYYYIPTNTSHLASDHQKIIETQLISLLSKKVQERRYKSETNSGISTENSASYSHNNSYDSRLGVEMSQNFNKNTSNAPEQLESESVANGGDTGAEENNELEVGYE
ncbi:hypothetical protein [Acinetobacter sp. Ver3]|uniref:hypothetical protein n=1 Tax=Acinetobacter sp. Ver3 TaxID=466088 RepID=UPI00044FDFF3|nr:hypothetical protein [Acinetobacter sp. Ver3]EZQ04771.1 hypothetical protein CL42_10630 [Acinetobacter sp. Ver3]